MESVAWYLGVVADFAAIGTAAVAVWIWFVFVHLRRKRRLELEEYLGLEREADKLDERYGLRSIVHLSGNLAMTPEQIHEAAFSSKVIKVWTLTDDSGKATGLMFQHEPKAQDIKKRERENRDAWVKRARTPSK